MARQTKEQKAIHYIKEWLKLEPKGTSADFRQGVAMAQDIVKSILDAQGLLKG